MSGVCQDPGIAWNDPLIQFEAVTRGALSVAVLSLWPLPAVASCVRQAQKYPQQGTMSTKIICPSKKCPPQENLYPQKKQKEMSATSVREKCKKKPISLTRYVR